MMLQDAWNLLGESKISKEIFNCVSENITVKEVANIFVKKLIKMSN